MKNQYLYAPPKKVRPVATKKRARFSIERLQKLTVKIKSAIKTKDVVKFNKWHQFIVKEEVEYKFNTLFFSGCMEAVKEQDPIFFEFILTKTVNLLNPDNIRRLILDCVNSHNNDNYDVIKKVLKSEFYKNTYFIDSLKSFYREGFNHDLENIFKLNTYSQIKGFCDNLHINKINNIDMTNELFKKLKSEDREKSYFINLTKSLQNNALEDIQYFFLELTSEFGLSEENKDKLITQGLKEEHIKLPGLMGEMLNLLPNSGIYMPTVLQLTKGGELFKTLLQKYELKTKLEGLNQNEEKSSRKLKL